MGVEDNHSNDTGRLVLDMATPRAWIIIGSLVLVLIGLIFVFSLFWGDDELAPPPPDTTGATLIADDMSQGADSQVESQLARPLQAGAVQFLFKGLNCDVAADDPSRGRQFSPELANCRLDFDYTNTGPEPIVYSSALVVCAIGRHQSLIDSRGQVYKPVTGNIVCGDDLFEIHEGRTNQGYAWFLVDEPATNQIVAVDFRWHADSETARLDLCQLGGANCSP